MIESLQRFLESLTVGQVATTVIDIALVYYLTYRLLLTILGPTGLEVSKEIVTTVEVSLYGARVRGIRTFRPDSQGVLTQLSSGQQAPVRIAWQAPAASPAGGAVVATD